VAYSALGYLALMLYVCGIPFFFFMLLRRERERGVRERWAVVSGSPRLRHRWLHAAQVEAIHEGRSAMMATSLVTTTSCVPLWLLCFICAHVYVCVCAGWCLSAILLLPCCWVLIPTNMLSHEECVLRNYMRPFSLGRPKSGECSWITCGC
jgi:hypothetical protein